MHSEVQICSLSATRVLVLACPPDVPCSNAPLLQPPAVAIGGRSRRRAVPQPVLQWRIQYVRAEDDEGKFNPLARRIPWFDGRAVSLPPEEG